MLAQQLPEATGTLDRPGPLRPVRSPAQQDLHLLRGRAHANLPDALLTLIERVGRVRPLVRIDTDHHTSHVDHLHHGLASGTTAAGTSEIRIVIGTRAPL